MSTTPPKSPFAALAALRAQLPPGEAPPPEPAADARAETPGTAIFGSKVVVSRSRKGRGGRTVTVVSGLRGDAVALDELCRAVKKGLGCGASVEGDTIVVAGEPGERLRALLLEAGARAVIVGN